MVFNRDRKLKRTGTYFIVAIVVLAALFFVYSSVGIESISSATSFEQDFSIYGTLDLASIDFKTSNSQVDISIGETNGNINIDGLNMDIPEQARIILLDYNGKISYEGTAKLDGCVISALIDSMVIAKNGKCLDVKLDTSFDSLKVDDVNLKSLKFISTGRLDAANKGSFNINAEEVEVRPFSGGIELRGSQFTISGTTENLLIGGKPRVSID